MEDLKKKGIYEENPIVREKCLGCGKRIPPDDPGTALFMCPNCDKGVIIRCSSCRKRAVVVECPNCGFEYP